MKKKIIVSMGLMVLLLMIQGIVSFVLLTMVDTATDKMTESEDIKTSVEEIEIAHYKWIQGLTLAVYTGSEFTGSLDSATCSLGTWLTSDMVKNSTDPVVQDAASRIKAPHDAIHEAAGRIVEELNAGDTAAAEATYKNDVVPNIEKTLAILNELAEHSTALSTQYRETRQNLSVAAPIILVAIVLIGAAIGVLMIVLLTKKIVPPLKKLTVAADNLSAGNIDVDTEVNSNDELGELAAAFGRMILGIRQQTDVIAKIAEGDYNTSLPVRSPHDVMNQSLNHMLDRSNEVFYNVRSASRQVADASAQIASGAQILATGSTQQAATIDGFTQSIQQVHAQAEDNKSLAMETVMQVEQAGQLMSEANGYMQQMTEAMNDINQSSEEIAKVIKVIDDIAFQTNILALNAAVEAARAGQHGKGFAVVADEVRNLASKSATAAKETAALIEKSVEKTTVGNHVVEKVNESLSEVGQISASNAVSMTKMRDASSEQSEAIAHITEDIAQLSTVVQANSATAQQSAAAAEEMNAQSASLDKLVAQFQLRAEDRYTAPALPQAAHSAPAQDSIF